MYAFSVIIDNGMVVQGPTEESFHQTTADVRKSKVHALCGNLTGK